MGMLLRRHYANVKTNNVKADGVTEKVAPKPVEEKKAEKSEPTITAEKINSMNGASLRKLAKENGVKDPEELTVKELRAILLDEVVK